MPSVAELTQRIEHLEKALGPFLRMVTVKPNPKLKGKSYRRTQVEEMKKQLKAKSQK